MARAIGPKKVHRYSGEFKVTAVKLANAPDVETKAVALGARLTPGVSGPIIHDPAEHAHIPLSGSARGCEECAACAPCKSVVGR
jgi:hypothetical protein